MTKFKLDCRQTWIQAEKVLLVRETPSFVMPFLLSLGVY